MYRAHAVYIRTMLGDTGMEDVTTIIDIIYGRDVQTLLSSLKGLDTENTKIGVKLNRLTIEQI